MTIRLHPDNYVPYTLATGAVNLNGQNLTNVGTFGAGAITGTSYTIGGNTLTTVEWAYLDGQDQAVNTTSDVTFNSVNIALGTAQNYKWTTWSGATNQIAFQSQDNDSQSSINFMTARGDGGDNILLVLRAKGTLTNIADTEYMTWGYFAGTPPYYRLLVGASGTGTNYYPLLLGIGGDNDMIYLAIDGKVGIQRAPTTYAFEVTGDIYSTATLRGTSLNVVDVSAGQGYFSGTIGVGASPVTGTSIVSTVSTDGGHGMNMTVTNAGNGNEAEGILITGTQSGGPSATTLNLIKLVGTSTAPQSIKGLVMSFSGGGSAYPIDIDITNSGSGFIANTLDSTIANTASATTSNVLYHAGTTAANVQVSTHRGSYVSITDSGVGGNSDYGHQVLLTMANTASSPAASVGRAYNGQVTQSGATSITGYVFQGITSGTRTDHQFYGLHLDNASGTINDPTVDQIGINVNNDAAGTDANMKRWAFYNAGTTATASKVLLGKDSILTYWGTGNDATINYNGTNWLFNPKAVGTGYMNIQGQLLMDDKIMFTQTDGKEYIDSLNDGYLDLGATTAVRIQNYIRHASASYRRYYHMPLFASDPGASGPTFVAPSATSTGGYRLDAATELLYFEADVHADWDAASDLKVEVFFQVNVNNTGGGAGDTVDLKLQGFFMGTGETAAKTPTIAEVATVVGQSAQYKLFKAEFTIDYDTVSNVVEVGDKVGFILNLETDTSEVDDIVVTNASFNYSTTHVGVESGDV